MKLTLQENPSCVTSTRRIYYLLVSIGHLLYTSTLNLDDLRYFEVVELRHIGAYGERRNRRDLSTFIKEENKHLDETAFEFSGHDRNFTLHLYKNDFLISGSFSYMIHTKGIAVNNCYYHGYLRDRVSSSAVVSTCNGLKGVLKDEDEEEFVIQPHPNQRNGANYILYKSRDVDLNMDTTCGVINVTENVYERTRYERSHKTSQRNQNAHYGHSNILSLLGRQTPDEHHRYRRSNTATKYIEVIVLVDQAIYNLFLSEHGSQVTALAAIRDKVLDIFNYVDSYYKWINTRVVIASIAVWHDGDKTPVTDNVYETLSGLETYTKDKLYGEHRLKFDHAHLITDTNWDKIVGLSRVGYICSDISAAVSRKTGESWTTANTVAHEIGHNIGFLHYQCNCTKSPCVMAPKSTYIASKSFADCTIETYTRQLEQGNLPCLMNYPFHFFAESVCGNGFIEDGEECDCGSEQECIASDMLKCCHFANCTLKASAQCGEGECCQDCLFKQRGVICRDRMNHDCDLAEYCTGDSHNCPDNFYAQDGIQCNNGLSYCYKGSCKDHNSQCETLWGPNATKADDLCFQANLDNADLWGSCGKDASGQYVRCAPGDQLCGKLQCMAKSPDVTLPEYPIIGTTRGTRTVMYRSGWRLITCIQGVAHFSPDMADPSITASGVKCADNSICISHRCVPFPTLSHIRCKKPCQNGGVCNNNGNCHCPVGFACPYCELPGSGGSLDSGVQCVYPDSCSHLLCQVGASCTVVNSKAVCNCDGSHYETRTGDCAVKENAFSSEIKLKRNFSEDLRDPSSAEFIQLARNVEFSLLNVVKESIANVEVVDVRGFEPGSVIAKYDIIMNNHYVVGDTNPLQLASAITQGIRNGTFWNIRADITYEPVVEEFNRCEYNYTHDCHKTRATCTNNESTGGYTCGCKAGFTGDGIICNEDLVETTSGIGDIWTTVLYIVVPLLVMCPAVIIATCFFLWRRTRKNNVRVHARNTLPVPYVIRKPTGLGAHTLTVSDSAI